MGVCYYLIVEELKKGFCLGKSIDEAYVSDVKVLLDKEIHLIDDSFSDLILKEVGNINIKSLGIVVQFYEDYAYMLDHNFSKICFVIEMQKLFPKAYIISDSSDEFQKLNENIMLVEEKVE